MSQDTNTTLANQLNTMLALQNKMNSRVHPDWRAQNFAWYRAIWTECAETMDHYGWKWWKKQNPDRPQVCMELVDIWHFGLSILILEERPAADVVASMAASEDEGTDFLTLLECFTASTLRTRSFNVSEFRQLMAAMNMTMDDLYLQYMGKNVLNFFRQDHGYKDGSYHKIWNGQEDNEHLVEALQNADATDPSLADKLYAELESRYPG